MTMPPVSDEENTTISLSDALSLRHKYTTLASAHSACSSRIAQLSSANLELSERLAELSREGTRRIGELEERAEVAEREARWERGTRVAGERKLRLAREELEVLRRVSCCSIVSRVAANLLSRMLQAARRARTRYSENSSSSTSG
jgi:hypothetical protein